MSEYVIIEKSELAAIAQKVRGISGSNQQMNALEIKTKLGEQVESVKETLTGYLVDNGKTVDENLSLKQLANVVETVEVELPVLTNEGSAQDLVQNKQLIDGEGNIVIGTNPYAKVETDADVATQADLIEQIATALEGKAAGGEAVEITLQSKTVTPATSVQTVVADSGYDGLDKVTVNAMPTATQATPSITVDANGKITASATQTAGYVAAGTKSATKQLTTQAAKTITPSTSSQTAVAKDVYTTGVVTVGAIPSNYIVPSGTLTITTNGTIDVKNYASATVNVASSGGGSGGNTEFEKSMITRTLTEYTNNELAKIGQYAFATCTNLSIANLPNCSLIDNYAFNACAKLANISFPVCSRINNYAFNGCTSLENISFPKCSMLNYYAFNNCTNLISADFPMCNYVHNGVFSNCSKLTTLVLNYSSVATLNNVGAFKNTPMSASSYTGAFGSIYVPASLVNAYKSATNWVTYADRITAIVE